MGFQLGSTLGPGQYTATVVDLNTGARGPTWSFQVTP
jgi:hypothetical protein